MKNLLVSVTLCLTLALITDGLQTSASANTHSASSNAETLKYCVYFNHTSQTASAVTTPVVSGPTASASDSAKMSCPESAAGSKASAVGTYSRSMNVTGWNVLNVTTLVATRGGDIHVDPSDDNQEIFEDNNAQAFSAGFLEGAASYQEIVWWHHNNLGPGAPAGKFLNPRVNEYVTTHYEWLANSSLTNERRNATWRNIALLYRQTEGMIEGANYESARRGGPTKGYRTFTKLQFWQMLAMTDITSDISNMFPTSNSSEEKKKTDFDIVSTDLHCSGLVAVSPAFRNIYFGHTTWMRYNTMLRIFKTFTLNFQAVPGFKTRTIQFSSYPGTLSSTDDFYVLSDSGFVVIETSLYMWNKTLYEANHPQQLLSNLRTMLANRMVTSGGQWASTFGFLNSGTYNNQWMILNMNLFTPGQDLKPGTLWIVEQLPGLIVASDETTILSFGYWPSYNIPFFPQVYQLAGYVPHAVINPNFFSHENCARAKIFRRIAGNISTLEDMKAAMRWNHFRTDPMADHNPWYAVAARGDLMPDGAHPLGQHVDASGGLDSKVGDVVSFMKTKTVHAIGAPTYGADLPVFDFDTTTVPITKVHSTLGLPRRFNFTWQEFHP